MFFKDFLVLLKDFLESDNPLKAVLSPNSLNPSVN